MQPSYDAFFNLFKACYDGLAFYPTGNPIVTQQLENFIRACDKHRQGEALILRRSRTGFSIDGKPLPPTAQALPSALWLAGVLELRQIHTLGFFVGLSLRDLECLMRLLQEDPTLFHSPEAAALRLKPHQVWRVQINPSSAPTPVENPFASFNGDGTYADLGFTAPPTRTAVEIKPDPALLSIHRGSVPTRPLDPFRPELPIDPDEQHTLYAAMRTAMQQGNLKRVAETLTLIRKDLTATQREDRELAFSSYHVVVTCMIDQGEDHSLMIVLKSMAEDLQACRESDLFRIHLATLYRMVDHFQKAKLLKGAAFGLNILANQHLRAEDDALRDQLAKILDRIVNLQLIESLLQAPDPNLEPIRKALFHRHGLGILKPLLSALFESEDRNLRKKILEIITSLGALSYPYLMEELSKAMNYGTPWYVKRNLLTLLSINPPPELMTYLPELYKEDRSKMRDLVVRCLFQIHGLEAFRMGKELLRQASGNSLMGMLRYLQLSRHGAYALEVMEVFKREEDPRIMGEAIQVLGKLDTEESVAYLVSILEKEVQTLGKLTTEQRIAAARMLARSQRNSALEALARHRRDFTREIREIAQSAPAPKS